jgi:predicted transcriptional regulator
MEIVVVASSSDEAGDIAVSEIEEAFEQTKGKLTVVGAPKVRTTSVSYLKKTRYN